MANFNRKLIHKRLDEALDTAETSPEHIKGLRVSQWDGLTKDSDNNPQITQLVGVQLQVGLHGEDPVPISTARPTIIRPTKRIKPTSDTKVEVFFGDTHHPFQDKRKLELAMIAIRELAPDVTTFLGDDLDMALFSRFESRAEWVGSTQASLDQFHQTLAQVKANAPETELVVHEGNHNLRFERELRKYNGELVGIRRADAVRELGVLTVPFLLRLDELDAEYVQGYPSAERWHSDVLKTFHGHVTNSSGSTVAKEIKTETVNFVHGHTHKAELIFRNVRVGREVARIFGMSPGTFADMNQAPSGQFATDQRGRVLPQHQDWHTTLGVVFHNEDTISPYLLPITDDGIDIFGKFYKS